MDQSKLNGNKCYADVTQQNQSNNKCYALDFRYYMDDTIFLKVKQKDFIHNARGTQRKSRELQEL